MPFQESTRMQGRQQLAHRVLVEGISVAQASREAGVSRPTAYLWLERATRDGIPFLHEHSRRPHGRPHLTDVAEEARRRVLELKARRPAWGAKKLHQKLWPQEGGHDVSLEAPPVCVRTVDRWLKAAGLVTPRSVIPPEPLVRRFERESNNELWQMDFKGLHSRWGYRPLTILDDHSRFCIRLEVVVGYNIEDFWPVVWQAMGEYGMPDCILCDNGDGFNSICTPSLTPFQAKLWRLGVRTLHGRPYHPQTQGKVERFHRTLEDEWHDSLRQQSVEMARPLFRMIRIDYNWERPHEALEGRVPGAVYRASSRPRPDRIPEIEIAVAAHVRIVDSQGRIRFQAGRYRIGRGLAGQPVEMREEEEGWCAFYTNRFLLRLRDVQL